MGDEDQPTASERAVQERLGEVADDPVARATENARPQPVPEGAMEDPSEHEAVPFENEASNPSSASPEGLAGDWGISSERTTARHARTDDTADVSLGEHEAPDVSQPDFAGHEGEAPGREDTHNKMWGDDVATGGETKPAPIADERSRREGQEPPPR